ncbi:unnamed protein product [Cylindrotheca closterium]|uniref:G-protein coupled receptors family 1 profile domain-containing protein n=1 Tax=Cylindrotheca closterium TaxID=2856 RepID=A0AAD2JGE2_9STRA|nr:unnamed protein product [Cylindrotheca closterium]
MSANFDPYQPSDTIQTVLSFLMVPTGILSTWGSSCIIRSIRKERKWSPYRRLMIALSICDIFSTVAYVLQPFLGPRESPYAYAQTIGNDATCTLMGAWSQLTFMAHWYSAALSFYFVSTVRYGVSETTFARKYERWIHFIIVTFHTVTAVVGAIGDVYFQRQINPGCWVAEPPYTCSGMNCHSELIAYIFGFPTVIALFVVLINNRLLYTHVKKTIVEGHRKAIEAEKRLRMYQQRQQEQPLQSSDTTKREGTTSPDQTNTGTPTSALQSSDKQWERVRQVRIQSTLYVVAYLITFAWSAIINILNSRRFQEQYEYAGRLYLPLLVLQSIFLPSQGLFNAMVFFRPRFMATRKKHPKQTRSWCARQSIQFEHIKPSSDLGSQDIRGVVVMKEEEAGEDEVVQMSKRDPSSIIPPDIVSGEEPPSAAQESERYFSSGRPSNGKLASEKTSVLIASTDSWDG